MTSRRLAVWLVLMGFLLAATVQGSNAAFSGRAPEAASFSAYGNFNDFSRITNVSAAASSSLVWWLDSSKPATVFSDATCTTPTPVGGSVQCWTDRRPGHSNLLAVAAAQRASTPIAGQAPIRFAGGAAMTGPDLLASTGTVTIFFVFRENVRLANFVFSLNGIITTSPGRFTLHAPWTDGNVFLDAGDTGQNRAHTPTNTITTGTPALLGAWKDPVYGHNRVQIDRKQIFDSTGYTVASTVGGIRVGALGSYSSNHDFAEILVFSSTLSDTDRYHVAQYLQTKWGTP
ncbi:MAG: hypothetical protein ACK5RL_20495 [Acidimicrobiales bacterium]